LFSNCTLQRAGERAGHRQIATIYDLPDGTIRA